MEIRQRVMSSLGVHHIPIAVLGMEVLFYHQRGNVSIASSWESDLDSLSVFNHHESTAISATGEGAQASASHQPGRPVNKRKRRGNYRLRSF